MDIDELTDREKSLILARMLKEAMLPGKYLPVMSPEFKPVNLYNPANMALAWRVLNWAWTYYDDEGGGYDKSKDGWYRQIERAMNYDESPADAQRAWLDKVLELAIEAGLIEV